MDRSVAVGILGARGREGRRAWVFCPSLSVVLFEPSDRRTTGPSLSFCPLSACRPVQRSPSPSPSSSRSFSLCLCCLPSFLPSVPWSRSVSCRLLSSPLVSCRLLSSPLAPPRVVFVFLPIVLYNPHQVHRLLRHPASRALDHQRARVVQGGRVRLVGLRRPAPNLRPVLRALEKSVCARVPGRPCPPVEVCMVRTLAA